MTTKEKGQAMKLEVNRRQLLEAVKRARKFQDKELAKSPVFEAIELSAEHGDLRVTAAGNFLWYEATLPADVERDGVALVSASSLELLLKASARQPTVALSMSGKKLAVGLGQNATAKLEQATANLKEGDAPTELPPIPTAVRSGGTVLLDSQFPTLQRILGKVLHVVPDPKEGQAVVRLSIGPASVEALAFDRFRIARASVPCGTGKKRDAVRLMLSGDLAARLLALKAETAFRLIEADGFAALAIGPSEYVVFRPIELESYPDVDGIDRKNASEVRAVFDRLELLRAAESVAAVRDALTGAAIESSGVVSGKSELWGSSVRIEVPVRTEGEWIVGINPSFLVEALKGIDSSEVELEVGPQLFARFRPAVSSRATELHEELVMAIRGATIVEEEAPTP